MAKPVEVYPCGDYLYRYEDYLEAAPLNEWEVSTGPGEVRVHSWKFKVVKRTPCGAWIYDHLHDRRRFVNLKAHRKFAYEQEEDALIGFYFRKLAQIKHNKRRLDRAERAKEKAIRLLQAEGYTAQGYRVLQDGREVTI